MDFERIVAVRNNKTVYCDGEDCIKLFREDYPKDDILNEALNQARVERTSLPVPKLKAITSFSGRWGIVSEYVEGKTLAEYIKEDPSGIDGYIDKLVSVQRAVNGETCSLLNRQRDKLIRKAALFVADEREMKRLTAVLRSEKEENCVCHGDLLPENVMITDDGYFVLDWAHVTRGNALCDVAFTYIGLKYSYGGEVADKYKKGYFGKDAEAESRFYEWIPIAATASMVGANGEKRNFLRSIVKEYGER